MTNSLKERIDLLLKIIGQQIRRHTILLIVVLSFILVGNIAVILGWKFSPDKVSNELEVAFYITHAFIMALNAAAIIFLSFVKVGKFSDFVLALMTHIFATLLTAWATIIFCFDLTLGFPQITYLIIATFIAGIFIVEPFYYIALQLLSFIPISVAIANNKEMFFGGQYFGENMTLFTVFIILAVLISFRNYQVVRAEYQVQKRLNDLSYIDELTGLLNERSYIDFTDDLDQRIQNGEDVKFAVILMDVNNLKATNDEYGHRYGCSLIVRCGKTLPTLFKSSKTFHIGGDEFVAIVMGEDLEKFEETMKRFDEAMLYSIVEHEGKKLIFSIARGYHIREDGQTYKEVLQIADNAMYENKKYLKEKYKMKGR